MIRDDLAFTTPAVLRADVLSATYGSFQKNLQADFREFRLYLNVDPAPRRGGSDLVDVLDAARSFFGDVVWNAPASASFPLAVKWLWSSVSSPFVFHLEDDWELLAPVPLDRMMSRMKDRSAILCRIPQAGVKNSPVVSMNPGLWRTSFCSAAAKELNGAMDPERQVRGYAKRHPGRVVLLPAGKGVARDTGRAWREQRGIRKPPKSVFSSWVENSG